LNDGKENHAITCWFWVGVHSPFALLVLICAAFGGCDRFLMARQIVPGALLLPLLSINAIVRDGRVEGATVKRVPRGSAEMVRENKMKLI
jgi:hypothetical protein